MNRFGVLVAVALVACGNKEPKEKASPVGAASSAPGSGAGSAAAAGDDVAQQVVAELASNAFGNQKIERRCVTLSAPAAAAGSTVVVAKLLAEPSCGDTTARSMVWVYTRPEGGAWKEDFLGSPPPCWKGVPAEIADAVATASGIPKC
ncbi:MAG TPA: hypothetical protein VIV40_39945 [Kofleriaceae bacterium]